MTKFTKEQLQEIAELARKATHKTCAMHMTNLLAVCDSEVIEEMARQLLASMEQEPMYQACKEAGVWVDVEPGEVFSLRANGEQVRPLYSAPQLQQPAVPDEAEMPGGPGVPEYNVGWANGWNSCREEMLHGAEPVRKPLAFFDGDISPEDAEKIIARIREMNSKPGSQQVMIAEPVSQPYTLRDGWVAVPVEMTPEQMRAVQRDSSLGTFASAHLSGAYDMYREFWNVAIAAAPQQEP